MKSFLIALLFALLFLAPAHLGAPTRTTDGLVFMTQDAEARRFGGFRSFGFRGSRGFGSFGRRGFSRRSFGSRPRARSFSRRPLRRSSFLGGGLGSGLFAGIGGFLLGGMIGRMLFGGMGGMGMGGGFGILEILLIGGIIFFIFRMMRNRTAAASQEPRYSGERYAEADPYGVGGYEEEPHDRHEEPRRQERSGGVYRGPDIGKTGGASRLARGSSGGPTPGDRATHRDSASDAALRKMAESDASFSEQAFVGLAKENFIRFQNAWTARDLSPVRDLMDKEIYGEVQRDIEGLKSEGKINKLDDVDIKSAEIVEAWNEEGYDFIAVRYEASLCDYVVEERSGNIVEGSRTERVNFSEHWTWVRPEGPNTWFLSAIEQA
ncbi:MAG: Tim44 domain-containing protein [Nitrospinae bacterium]|nr:Tim44 domain-containing protein [Nitrospinota bacterium]